MNRKFFNQFYTLLLALLCFSNLTKAQNNYPVRGVALVNSQASAYLQDFANPVKNPIRLSLQLQDLSLGSRSVYLKVLISGPGGFSVRSNDYVATSLVLTLQPGVLSTVPTPFMAQYFNSNALFTGGNYYERAMPAGLYTFHYVVYDRISNAKLSDEITSAPVWIEAAQPPVLILPINAKDVGVLPVQNVLFQWAPRHTQINDVEYEFILTELPITNRGNIQNVFLSQPPLYKTTLNTNSFLYSAKYPPLREGYTYAWRVQSKAKAGKENAVGIFENNGISEIFSFLYANPMLPPSNVKASWGSDFKYVTIDWKGQDNHSVYNLTIKDVDGNIVKDITIEPNFSKNYSIQVAGLSPVDKYTYKIATQDFINRKAECLPQNIAANDEYLVAERLNTAIELKGALTWSYKESETDLPKENTLIVSKTENRKQEKIDWANTKASSKKYALENANVGFFGSNTDLTEASFSNMTMLETVKSNDDGEFVFRNVKIAQLTDFKYFYLYITYKNKALDPVFAKIKIDETVSTDRDAGSFNMMANTFRYSPKLYDPKGKISASIFEDVSLYRLKSIVEQEKALFETEGNANPRSELIYNKTTYVKIADLKESNVISLFGNSLFNDQFVLKLKYIDKGFNDTVYPIDIVNTNAVNDKESFKITDALLYIEPYPAVKGYVAYGNENKNTPIADQQVSIFSVKESDLANKSITGAALLMNASWKTNVTTDSDGKYELDIAKHISENKSITKIGILVTKPGGGQALYKVIDKPKATVNHSFYFTSEGVAVVGYLRDQFDRPIVDALVSYPNNNSVRSNANGAFVLNITEETDLKKESKIQVKAQDFKNASFDLSTFEVVNNNDLKDEGLAFYKAKVSEFSKANNLNIEATDELFKEGFKSKNAKLVKLMSQKNMLMESVEIRVNIRTYVNGGYSFTEGVEKKYLDGAIVINDEVKNIPQTGYTFFVKDKKSISFTIANREGANTLYLEETIKDYELPESSQNGKAFEINVLLKEAVMVRGKVIAYDKNQKIIGPLEGVDLEIEGGVSKATSKEGGVFEILIDKELSSAFSAGSVVIFSKDDYNTELVSIKGEKTRTLEEDIKIYQQDPDIPKFTHLQGFSVNINRAISKGNNVYEISGSVDVTEVSGGVNGFELKEGEKLTFKNIPVRKDKTDEENAVLSVESMAFDQTVIKLKLHKYASITLSGKPAIRMIKVTTLGQDNKGKIVGTVAKITPDTFLGGVPAPFFHETKLEYVVPDDPLADQKMGFNSDVTKGNQKKLDAQKPKQTEAEKEAAAKATKEKEDAKDAKDQQLKALDVVNFPVFVAEGLELEKGDRTAEYKLIFPKITNIAVKKDTAVKIPEGFVTISIGLKSQLDMNPDKALLTNKGVFLEGQLRLPKMAGTFFKKHFILERIVAANNEAMDLKEASVLKSDSGTFATVGVKGSFRFDIEKIQIFDNFKRYGIGGKLFTSKENHLIVNSMTWNEVNDKIYPSLNMKFPEKGYQIKELVFKSPKEQNIILAYNLRDDAYQIDAGAILELKNPNKYPTAKKIFPLEVQKLIINTNGAFMVSIKANVSIEIGPVKINIRRLLFSKGKTMEWRDMNEYMLRDSTENANLTETKTFNNKNYEAVSDKTAQGNKEIGNNYQVTGKVKLDDDIALENDYVNWVFGFAGGVQIDKLKGAKVKTDVSFLLGDMGDGIEVKFNSIDIVIDAPSYKAFASIKLMTSGPKIGFEGSGEVETLTQKFGASIKFYQLAKGIEFGASLVANTTIVTGPLTWTAIGGLIDINTATNKYTIGFLGKANPTGTSKEITEFRNIKITLLFSTNDCGVKPVLEGNMDWYNKGERYCYVKVKLDFCRMLLLATMDCEKEVVKGSWAKINATVFVSTKSLFLAASIRVKVFGQQANGSVILGINTDFNDVLTPKEVKVYSTQIEKKYLTNGSIVDGIFVRARVSSAASSSGDFWIAAYSINFSNEFDGQFALNWNTGSFELGVATKVVIKAKVMLLGVTIGGGLNAGLEAKGGYNTDDGWFFDAKVHAEVEVYLNDGEKRGCNSFSIKICWVDMIPYPTVCCFSWKKPWGEWGVKYVSGPIPCGFDAKVCIGGQLSASYYQNKGGFKVKL